MKEQALPQQKLKDYLSLNSKFLLSLACSDIFYIIHPEFLLLQSADLLIKQLQITG